ncbi:MAG: class I SAM-dependent methyltransferase [Alphaproteobacteria bacterium]|nr:class I SAM-dependent methyltransferase [Alphaproteobacteria bacterium]
MLEHMKPILAEAERAAASGGIGAALTALRKLALDDFGVVMLEMPNGAYPNLSKVLPRMASPQVQENWTGASGYVLLRQSLNFTRILANKYAEVTGESLSGKRILDYGCGYGRLLRTMLYFGDPGRLFGCDPWTESIRLCEEAAIPVKLDVTEYLPQSLPYEPASIDLAYAFSVFTHTSLRASRAALGALRQVMHKDGLLALTIRPVEYWAYAARNGDFDATPFQRDHREKGFAFKPHNRPPIDGDITYGDTSMTFPFLEEIAEGWRLHSYEHSLDDLHQLVMFLQPR